MTDEQHDLLVRIDERMQSTLEEVSAMRTKIDGLQCQAHAVKIKILGKFVYGTALVSLGAIVKSFWGVIVK